MSRRLLFGVAIEGRNERIEPGFYQGGQQKLRHLITRRLQYFPCCLFKTFDTFLYRTGGIIFGRINSEVSSIQRCIIYGVTLFRHRWRSPGRNSFSSLRTQASTFEWIHESSSGYCFPVLRCLFIFLPCTWFFKHSLFRL